MYKVSVFGLGKLGFSMVVAFAKRGCRVIGYDVIDQPIQAINDGYTPIQEAQCQELLTQYRDSISATNDPEEAIAQSDITFIIVPTPSLSDGSFSTEYVIEAIKRVGEALITKSEPHYVVLTSTVMPGDTEKMRKILEKVSGKSCGDYLLYSPEFIKLGSVVRDFLNPDMILIGEHTAAAGQYLENLYREILENEPSYHRMNYWNAELTKISLNHFLATKITYTNVVSEICEHMPGGNALQVLGAIGRDCRIGEKLLRPGLAAGGPCLPRDQRAFSRAAWQFGVEHTFSTAIDDINNYQKAPRIIAKIKQLLEASDGNSVAILGLSYKENTPVIEESVPVAVAGELITEGYEVSVYDPLAMANAGPELVGAHFTDSVEQCLIGASVCFIATAWDEFKALKPEDFMSMAHPVVLDAWGVLTDTVGLDVYRIGINR